MNLTSIDRLLDPAPMQIETGYERLADGVLHVACRTDLHGCTGEMFEWWFRFRPNTQQYIWWHPIDHISSDWTVENPESHVGSVHLVEEFFSGRPAEKLAIQFRRPDEFFDPDALAAAIEKRDVTGLVCGRVGFGFDPPKDADGRHLGGRLIHLCRDTPWGASLRSHFYMGQDLPAMGMAPAAIEDLMPDGFGQALLKHCYDEFTFLSRFLPSLFVAEHRDIRPVPAPW